MFPLRDSIPSARRPVVNLVVIGACVVVFLYEFMLGPGVEAFVNAFGFVPARFFDPAAFNVGPGWGVLTLVTSMFMHGGWLHLIGNMWFLWVFGDNVEDCLGHGRYVFFYLVCGAAAALAQAAIAPSSTVPMVGASGAIAGVLGAYLVWYPWSRIHTFVFLGIFFTTAELPAPVFLVIWFVIQFFSGALSLASAGPVGGGVAFFAHVGGFVAGALLAWWLRRAGHVHPFTRDRLTFAGGYRA
jgi:membrane associated rhomboid family serine protease